LGVASVRRDLPGLDHRLPSRVLGELEGGESFGGAADDFEPEFGELLLHLCIAERGHQ
jgi:hypothetical protein